MASLPRGFVFLAILSVIKGDYSCVCNYDEENYIYSQPDLQSHQIDTLYEFDCKPSYDGYKGNGFTAIQIGGKIGYVDSQTNIQLQTCSGDASPNDLFTTKHPIQITSTTNQMPTASTSKQMPTASTTKQMPTASTTKHMPTTTTTKQMPSATTSKQWQTDPPNTPMPTATSTNQVPTATTSKQIHTASTTSQMPIATSTNGLPTVTATKLMPSVKTTKQNPSVSTTTQMPTATTTKQMPTDTPTKQIMPDSTTTKIRRAATTTQKKIQSTTTLFSTTFTTTSTSAYHKTNVTNNVLQYIGVAYNLTNGNPLLGKDKSTLVDPGLLLGKQVFELNEYLNGSSREVEIMNLTKTCNTQYALIHNGKSYQEELFTLVRPTAEHPQQLKDSAFIFNKEFNNVRSFTKNHTNVYQDALTVCSEQNLRLKDELVKTEPLSVTRDFAKDACDLPEQYDVNKYIDFLDKWGTSIVTEVLLGTKHLQRHKTTVPTVFNLVSQKNPGLLHHSGSYMGYASSLTLARQDYVRNTARTVNLGSSVTTYTNQDGPVPVGLKLVPITFAFDWKFWKDRIGEFQAMGICRDDITASSVRGIAENLNQTLNQYIDLKKKLLGINISPFIDTPLQIPVTWPKGTYGLMKPKNGCPAGHVTWHEGWRVQDSRNLGVHNRFSSGISNTLSGTFDNRELQTKFCMKTDSTITPYDREWPAGNYCILKKNACPSGFSSGSIYWDDRDFINKNKHGGTLPDGTYDRNTKIYYCCRLEHLTMDFWYFSHQYNHILSKRPAAKDKSGTKADGSTSNPITLPIDRVFVLIRYKGACQKVYNMNWREVFIQWDTANVGNDDEDKGAHPLDDGGKEHKLHFCYYYFNTGGVIIG